MIGLVWLVIVVALVVAGVITDRADVRARRAHDAAAQRQLMRELRRHR